MKYRLLYVKVIAKTCAKNKLRKSKQHDKIPRMTVTTSNKIGYARVSTAGQNLDSQLDALKAAGCSKIFADRASGAKASRPEWDKLMEYLRPGDIVVVAELSRMSRSLMHLLQLAQDFTERQIGLISLREHIDTSTATGRAFFAIMGAINQLELELRAERTEAGRAAARARGKTGGRPRTDQELLERARILSEHSNESIAQICSSLGIGRRTFYDYMARVKNEGITNCPP